MRVSVMTFTVLVDAFDGDDIHRSCGCVTRCYCGCLVYFLISDDRVDHRRFFD